MRRIKPTPVGKVTTTFQATTQFGSSASCNAGPSDGSAAALSEERRLLIEERSRQGSKSGKKHNRNVKLAEVKSPIILAAEDNVVDTDTVTSHKDVVVAKEENITDGTNIPSLSAVTDKIQLDSIAQCYSSLLKGDLLTMITFRVLLLL